MIVATASFSSQSFKMDKWLKRKQTHEDPDQDSGPSTSHNVSKVDANDQTECKNKNPEKITQVKKRKYDESYLKFGFTWSGSADEPSPQCVICSEILSKNSMKPSLLKRHFESKHGNLINKDFDYFKRLLEDLNSRKSSIKIFSGTDNNAKALKASYKVSHLIAKSGKNHTIGENLILPATLEIVSCMFGEKEAKSIKNIPLSNDTVSRRISDMANNTKEQLVQAVRESSWFAIQIDETTDVAGLAQLIVFVRGVHGDEVFEDLLFCKPLNVSTKGRDIFALLDSFFSANRLDWKNCVSVCMDGAKAMSGHITGLAGCIKNVSPECNFNHCVLHREALAAKNLPDELKVVLDESVKIVNFIKTRPQKSREFKIISHEMGSLHESLLLHTEVRWLSRGNVLARVFELHKELHMFFTEQKFNLSSVLGDFQWLLKLAYLGDIFEKLNIWNKSMQGSVSDIFYVENKTNAMVKKITLWKNEMESNNCSTFKRLNTFLNENEQSISAFTHIKNQIVHHLSSLKTSIREYFPPTDKKLDWIRDPFSFDTFKTSSNLSTFQKEQLIELSCDPTLKKLYSSATLLDFWVSVKNEYPEISNNAVKVLIGFSTTYLCERGFSSLTYLKNKYRNKLNVEDDMRLYLTKFQPNIEELCKMKQAHPSH